MAQSKFTQYFNLAAALRRNGVKPAPKVATILLQTFIELDGRMRAVDVYSKNLCAQGKFTEWRKSLIEKGWLDLEVSQDKNYAKYRPGRKLLPYVNREKLSSKEVATRDEVDSLEIKTLENTSRIDRLEKELNQVKLALINFIKKNDPPVTQEKLQAALTGEKDLDADEMKLLGLTFETVNEVPF